MRERPIELDAAWPGLGLDGAVVIPVDPRAWPPPTRAVEHAGIVFDPKPELHVTVVGRTLGSLVRDAIAAGALSEGAVRAAFEAGRWRLRRSGWCLHLRRDASAEKTAADSLIEPVALPAMARFHARLGALLGRPLPVPPPHVTLFVAGTREGIGVADGEALARMRRGPAFSVES